jgi:hypothetical protein
MLLAGTIFQAETALDSDDAFLLDGRRLRKSLYPELFDRIGDSYGVDEEFFFLPDLLDQQTLSKNQWFFHVVVRDLPLPSRQHQPHKVA